MMFIHIYCWLCNAHSFGGFHVAILPKVKFVTSRNADSHGSPSVKMTWHVDHEGILMNPDSFEGKIWYIPRTQMTSIFGGQPHPTKAFSNKNKGHFGSRYASKNKNVSSGVFVWRDSTCRIIARDNKTRSPDIPLTPGWLMMGSLWLIIIPI